MCLVVLQATEEAAPQHAAIARDGTLRTLLSLFLPHLQLTAQSMKLQANAGEHALLARQLTGGRCWGR